MYSLKFAHLILEKLPEAEVFEYFIDMRSFGKGYEEFYERIREEGVSMIRGKTAKVEEKNGKLLIRGEDILRSRIIENPVDMVVLSSGLEPGEDTETIWQRCSAIPFLKEDGLKRPTITPILQGHLRGGSALQGPARDRKTSLILLPRVRLPPPACFKAY